VVASNLVITFPTMAILPHPLFSGQRTKRTARASRAQLAHSFYLRKRTICSWRERLLRVGSTDPFAWSAANGKIAPEAPPHLEKNSSNFVFLDFRVKQTLHSFSTMLKPRASQSYCTVDSAKSVHVSTCGPSEHCSNVESLLFNRIERQLQLCCQKCTK
jgi:hypothetical protein